MSKSALFLSLCLAALSTHAAGAEACATAANVVQNCGFESGSLSNWSVLGDAANVGVDEFDAHTGAYGAYLAGFGSFAAGDQNFSELQQNLTTVTRQTYTLTYYSAHLTNADVTPDNIFAAAVNGSIIVKSLQLNVGNVSYEPSAAYTFVANSPVTSLSFLAEDTNFVFSLDDVSVVATPEPASLLLILAAGVIGGLTFLYREIRQGVVHTRVK